jgi:hypothetical protein
MKKKEASPKRIPSAPRKMGSFELCASLSAIAAFPVEDKDSQMKIYEAIKRLQLLEKALLPHDPPDGGQGRANTPGRTPPAPHNRKKSPAQAGRGPGSAAGDFCGRNRPGNAGRRCWP